MPILCVAVRQRQNKWLWAEAHCFKLCSYRAVVCMHLMVLMLFRSMARIIIELFTQERFGQEYWTLGTASTVPIFSFQVLETVESFEPLIML